MFFRITGIFLYVFLGHKVLKKNIWMNYYIGEEILDGCDQTIQKSELKRRSYAIFMIVLNLSTMDSEHLLVFWP